jgi:hypothetical protein
MDQAGWGRAERGGMMKRFWSRETARQRLGRLHPVSPEELVRIAAAATCPIIRAPDGIAAGPEPKRAKENTDAEPSLGRADQKIFADHRPEPRMFARVKGPAETYGAGYSIVRLPSGDAPKKPAVDHAGDIIRGGFEQPTEAFDPSYYVDACYYAHQTSLLARKNNASPIRSRLVAAARAVGLEPVHLVSCPEIEHAAEVDPALPLAVLPTGRLCQVRKWHAIVVPDPPIQLVVGPPHMDERVVSDQLVPFIIRYAHEHEREVLARVDGGPLVAVRPLIDPARQRWINRGLFVPRGAVSWLDDLNAEQRAFVNSKFGEREIEVRIRHHRGESYAAIAEALKISKGQVQDIMRRTDYRLRERGIIV